jgi:hypothetical protein
VIFIDAVAFGMPDFSSFFQASVGNTFSGGENMDNFNSLFVVLGLRKLLKNKHGYNDDGTPIEYGEEDEDFPP